jgi:Tfp pilus assembly protein PilP
VFLKKQNNILLLTLLCYAVISFGVSSAQTGAKITVKIPKEEKIAVEKPKAKADKNVHAKKEGIEEKGGEEKDGAKEQGYFYDPTNKTDPFKSFISIKDEIEGKAQEEPRTYLETLDISQLTVSGIVLSGKDSWALIRDSKGDGHVIKIETPIGKNRGKVVRITENEIIVREQYKNIKGKTITRDISIKLPGTDKLKER